VHRDGLGSKRVRLQDGPFVFSNPADRELYARQWQVTARATNGST
jgi:hypothetical protein